MANENLLYHCLKQINEGSDPEKIKSDKGELFKDIKPSELAMAEQMLLDTGCSVAVLRRNQSRYIKLLGDQLHKLWSALPYNHIARRILSEHEVYQCVLSDLNEVNELIQQAQQLSDVSAEFRRLVHISQHLAAVGEHSQYEEDILYPELRKHKLGHLVRAMNSDHAYIKFSINSLVKLIDEFENLDLLEFKVRLDSVSGFVVNSIREHIFVENYILLPLALELIKDEQVWKRMKRLCDEMGYCGFHDVEL